MKNLYILILFMVSSITCYSQVPTLAWQKCLGGSALEQANAIEETSDGGYIVAGRSQSTDGDVSGNHGTSDYWIVKVTSTGIIQWQKSFGGTGDDRSTGIQQTSDGGYIVAGYSNSTNGDITNNKGGYDYWVVKLDNTGTITWQKSLGGSSDDIANNIGQTSDGGYIVTGYTTSLDGDVTGYHGGVADYWVVKLNSSGVLQWQKCLGGTGDDRGSAIQQTSDGGYIVTGYSNSNNGNVSGNHGSYDYWIVRLNNTGTIQWQKSLGGTLDDRSYSAQQTSDGDFIVTGYAYSSNGDVSTNHGSSDYWILKLDDTGTIVWQRSLGGSSADIAYCIRQTADKGFIVAGYTSSANGDVTTNHGATDYWLTKLDSTGTLEWEKTFGGTSSEFGNCLQPTSDNGYVMAGYTSSNDGDVSGNHGSSDYWIVKLNPGTLPLTLLSFTAHLQQANRAQLNWSTANEVNNDHFTVQRGRDVYNFISIADVKASGAGAAENNYTYMDNLIPTGTVFYRLIQSDKDGKANYSKIISLQTNAGIKLTLKPNPSVTGKFNMDLGEIKDNIRITVTDNNGKQVYAKEVDSAKELTVDLNKVKGIYFLQIFYDGGKASQTLVVE